MSDQLRDDLAALLVDREEQARLDSEFELDLARVTAEFGIVPTDVMAKAHAAVARLVSERHAAEVLATKVRGLIRTAFVPSRGEILVVRQWWESLGHAIEDYDVVKDRS